MGDHRSRRIRDAFRRQYLHLLVRALAKIRDTEQGSMLQSYRAVRLAADTSFVAAARSSRCSYLKSLRPWLIRRRKRRRSRRVLIRRNLQCQGYLKSLRSPRQSPRSASIQNARPKLQSAHINDFSIPAESELKRLQTVIFPKTTRESVIEPGILFTQAAHYILALQVQVDALNNLASQAASISLE